MPRQANGKVRKPCVALCLMVGTLGSTVLAQQSSGGTYTIARHTVDNGGGASQGGQFSVTGTMAQLEANERVASGGAFSLRGGFWRLGEVTPREELLFSDGFESP